MKNVKFRGISTAKKTNSAVNSAAQIPRKKPKFRGSARNSAGRRKLWALLISQSVNMPISKSTTSQQIMGQTVNQ